MNNSGCTIKVPGKLMIAGEYAVLEPGYKAVVVAVDRHITTEVRLASSNSLVLSQLGFNDVTWEYSGEEIVFNIQDEKLCFIQNALKVSHRYLKDINKSPLPFTLSIISDLNDPETGKKYGLGSSAAIVTSVISAFLYIHGEYNGKEDLIKIFKLSAMAHVITQRNGSGADIAAACFGGWIQYSSYSSLWLLNKLSEGYSIKEIHDMTWPNLFIERIVPPKALRLAVGWTKESVGTAPMVKKIQEFQKNHKNLYNEFLEESYNSVAKLINAFENNEVKKALEALHKNRKALLKLSDAAKVNIETRKIKTLCSIADIFGIGKSSGAGGGDCGIAFVEDGTGILELKNAWKENGIEPLNLLVSPEGCSIYKNNKFL
ncbi:phosphomevalonate kinase [Alloiococcus sp. CFN-8]|uniref:phosphomevalonate kinase n=1 Tax=Alloiococcus sp. CFN-8 TaxID=3416081 RepID=UPI003CEEBD50